MQGRRDAFQNGQRLQVPEKLKFKQYSVLLAAGVWAGLASGLSQRASPAHSWPDRCCRRERLCGLPRRRRARPPWRRCRLQTTCSLDRRSQVQGSVSCASKPTM